MSERDVGILRHSAWLKAGTCFVGNGRGENYAVALLRIGEKWTPTALCDGR